MSQIQILKAEIDRDPLARGYSGMSDQEAADSINAKDRSRTKNSMSGSEIAAAINKDDYNGLSDAKKSRILTYINSGSIDPTGFAVIAIKDIFGAGSTTLSNLAAARNELISRASELGLSKVKQGHVINARAK